MARFNVRSKKPKGIVKEKTPMREKVPSIEHKTPNDSIEQFNLPPSRKSQIKTLDKEKITYPTSYGIKEKSEEQPQSMNRPLPVNQIQDREKSVVPSSKGTLQESRRKDYFINRKIPIQVKTRQDHENIPPTRRGIAEKKLERIKNKTPQQAVRKKIPKNKPTSPPSTLGLKQNDKKTFQSKTPPKNRVENSPIEQKSIPPTIIKTKIPKISIRRKKPE